MIRTILFFLVLWIVLIMSVFLLIPYLLPYRAFPVSLRNGYTAFITRLWAGITLGLAGIKLRVKGNENIPGYPVFVIVSNHQGNMDITVIIRLFPYLVSFVTKKELVRIPIISSWIKVLRCPVINRSHSEEARSIIQEHFTPGIQNPLLIFPEGTRSQSMKMRKFRTGGLGIIKESGLPVLPVSIKGSFRCYEEKGLIRPGIIEITIHQVLDAASYTNSSLDSFVNELQRIIRNGLNAD